MNQAIQVLYSKYNALIDSAVNGEIDAEVSFNLDGQRLKLQMLLNASSARAYEAHAWVPNSAATPQGQHLERQSNDLLSNPKILAFIEQIKADLGIATP